MSMITSTWRRLFGSLAKRETGRQLYIRAVARAREPVFFTGCGVPDTVDGRFDNILLHVVLIVRHLRRHARTGAGEAEAVAQDVFDIMFADMDQSLREMGVGDLSVGRKVRYMAEAFYGRANTYESALDGHDPGELREALVRNLWGGNAPADHRLASMENYVREQDAALAGLSFTQLTTAECPFAGLPRGETSADGASDAA